MIVTISSTEVKEDQRIRVDSADIRCEHDRIILNLHFQLQTDAAAAIATLQNFPIAAGAIRGSVALQMVSINLEVPSNFIVYLS